MPSADGVLARVRENSAVRCGAEARAGFAALGDDGQPGGLAVELCGAIAVAVLGPQAKIIFRLFREDGLDAIRPDDQDVVFVSGATVAAQHLAGALIAGPTVFIDPVAVMVPQDSATRDFADLGGAVVCFMAASPAQRALEEEVDRLHLEIARMGFREEVEMLDAYNVQRCQAMVGDTTTLTAAGQSPGVNRLLSRLLPRALAETPLFAATPAPDDAWAALVRRVLPAGPQPAGAVVGAADVR